MVWGEDWDGVEVGIGVQTGTRVSPVTRPPLLDPCSWEFVDGMWAMDEADGPLPVSVLKSVWASKQELCDFMQMIEAEHRQCLEKDPLWNETAGEPRPQ